MGTLLDECEEQPEYPPNSATPEASAPFNAEDPKPAAPQKGPETMPSQLRELQPFVQREQENAGKEQAEDGRGRPVHQRNENQEQQRSSDYSLLQASSRS
jgi:hypothetical protein